MLFGSDYFRRLSGSGANVPGLLAGVLLCAPGMFAAATDIDSGSVLASPLESAALQRDTSDLASPLDLSGAFPQVSDIRSSFSSTVSHDSSAAASGLPELPQSHNAPEDITAELLRDMSERSSALFTAEGAAGALRGIESGGGFASVGSQLTQAAIDSGLSRVERAARQRFFRTINLNWSPGFNGRESLYQIDGMMSLYDGESHSLMTQLGLQSRDGEAAGNLGVVWRTRAIADWMLGFNAFYDYLSEPDVDRWSAGVDIHGTWLSFSSNIYTGLSEDRSGSVVSYSPDGWDIEVAGHAPSLPWLHYSARHYNWDVESGDDLEGQDYKLTLRPMPLVDLSLRYDRADGGDDDFGFEAQFQYEFGRSLQEQLSFQNVSTASDPWQRRFERVRREYEQRVQTRGGGGGVRVVQTSTSCAGSVCTVTLAVSNVPAGTTQVTIATAAVPISSPGVGLGRSLLRNQGSNCEITGEMIADSADCDYAVTTGVITIPIIPSLAPNNEYTFSISFEDAAGAELDSASVSVSVVPAPVNRAVSRSRIAEAGGTSILTFTLGNPPVAGDVTVAIARDDSSTATLTDDYTISAETVTLNATVTSVEVTVTAVEDTVGEGDETIVLSYTITGITGSSIDRTTITITDDDTPIARIYAGSVGTQSAIISEAGTTSQTLTVELVDGTNAITADGDITINLQRTASGAVLTTDYAVAGLGGTSPDYTITIPDGMSSVSFTVTAVDDSESDSGESVSFNIQAGTGYTPFTGGANTVAVAINDDDSVGVTSSGGASVAVTEGGTAAYTLVLTTQPSADVTISLTSSDPTAVTVPASLTFTTGNWNNAQTVTVTAVEDDDRDSESVTISYTISGGGYDSVTLASQAVAVTDDDDLTVRIYAGSAGNQTATIAEAGTTSQILTVALVDGAGATVTADSFVTVNLQSIASGGAVLTTDYTVAGLDLGGSGPDYVITIPNGMSSANFMVTAVDDSESDSGESVSFTIQTGNGYRYTPATGGAETVAVSITDNDVRGITSTAGAIVAVTEGGTAEYTLVLDTRPSDDVTIALTSTVPTAVMATGSLMFTDSNWNMPQTVTLTGVEDDDVSSESVMISYSISGGDYSGVGLAPQAVAVTDNDARGVSSTGGGRIAVTEGGAATYTLVLTTQPTATVNIALTSSDTTAVTVSASLSFTTANWDTPQTVTVTGVEDADRVGESVMISYAISGGDYSFITLASQAVAVTDNEARSMVTAVADVTTIDENRGASELTITLVDPGADDVVVAISASGSATPNTDYSVLAGAVTLNAARPTAIVLLRAINDFIVEGDETITLSFTLSGAGSAGLSMVSNISLSITDDDMLGVTSTGGASVGLVEGMSTSYTLVLDTRPTDDVTISLTSSDVAIATVSPASLVFTPSNWNVPQEIMIAAIRILGTTVDDGAMISYTVSGGDYDGFSIPAQQVDIRDDDAEIGIVPSPVSITIMEGRTARYRLRPTDDNFNLDLDDTDNVFDDRRIAIDIAIEPATSPLRISTGSVNINEVRLENITIQSVEIPTLIDGIQEFSTGILRLRALHDDDADDETVMITHVIDDGVTNDPDYSSSSVTILPLIVTIIDDDDDMPGFSDLRVAVREGAATTILPLTPPFSAASSTRDYSVVLPNNVDGVSREAFIFYGYTGATTSVMAQIDSRGPGDGIEGFRSTLPGGISLDLTSSSVSGISVLAGGAQITRFAFTGEGSATATYFLRVSREADASTELGTLRVLSSPGGTALWSANTNPLTTRVDSSTHIANVPNTASSITIDAVGADPGATITANGNSLDTPIALVAGTSTEVRVRVSSAGLADRVYTIMIFRAPEYVAGFRGATSQSPPSATIESGGADTATARIDFNERLSVALPLTIGYSLVNGASDSDFSFGGVGVTRSTAGFTLTVVAPAGATSVPISVMTTASSSPGEGVILQLVDGAGYNLLNPPNNSERFILQTVVPLPIVTLAVSSDDIPETGGASTLTFTLANAPLDGSNVTVAIARDGSSTATLTDDYTITGTPVTLNATTSSQIVTVAAVPDTAIEGDETIVLSYTVTGSPIPIDNTTITITDDDAPMVTLDVSSTDIAEARGTSTLTFTLDNPPADGSNVMVAIASDVGSTATSNTDYSVSPGAVTLNAGRPTALVLLRAINDFIVEGDETIVLSYTVTGITGSTIANTTITIMDDDTIGVTSSTNGASLNHLEGRSISYTLVLDTQPTANVTISLSNSNVNIATVSPASLAFSPSNWNVPQEIMIEAGADGNAVDDVVMISYTVSGGNYDGLSIPAQQVDIQDNGAAVRVTPSVISITIREGQIGRYTLRVPARTPFNRNRPFPRTENSQLNPEVPLDRRVARETQPVSVDVAVVDPASSPLRIGVEPDAPDAINNTTADVRILNTNRYAGRIWLQALHDDDTDDETVMITHVIDDGDSDNTDYRRASVTIRSVMVTIIDDDDDMPGFSDLRVAVREGAATTILPLTPPFNAASSIRDYSVVLPNNVDGVSREAFIFRGYTGATTSVMAQIDSRGPGDGIEGFRASHTGSLDLTSSSVSGISVLAGGAQIIRYVFTGEGGATATYFLRVSREANASTELGTLRVLSSPGGTALWSANTNPLTTRVDPGTHIANVPNTASSITIDAVGVDPAAMITANGNSLDTPIALVAGTSTSVRVRVSSAGLADRVYTIMIFRAPEYVAGFRGATSRGSPSATVASGESATARIDFNERLSTDLSLTIGYSLLDGASNSDFSFAGVGVTRSTAGFTLTVVAPAGSTSVSISVTATAGSSAGEGVILQLVDGAGYNLLNPPNNSDRFILSRN